MLSYDDMPGLSIDMVVHMLPIDPNLLLVKKKLRKLKIDMSVIIKEDITKKLRPKSFKSLHILLCLPTSYPSLIKTTKFECVLVIVI